MCVNVTSEVKDFRLIYLDTNRVSREEVSAQLSSGELSVEIVGDLLWGGYLRAVKCASFSALGVDLPSIALKVLHSFVGSVL